MTRISQQKAIELGLMQKKKPKYGAKKVEVDGIRFDSKKEARKYEELKLMKRAGVIKDFELQPEFELQPKFADTEGNYYQPIKYRADFKVYYPNGDTVIIDTKGYRTKDYLLKRKMLLYKYPGIKFIEE